MASNQRHECGKPTTGRAERSDPAAGGQLLRQIYNFRHLVIEGRAFLSADVPPQGKTALERDGRVAANDDGVSEHGSPFPAVKNGRQVKLRSFDRPAKEQEAAGPICYAPDAVI